MNPEVLDLAVNASTQIWTNGWRASAQLAQSSRLEVVVHRREWVSNTGVHTNTAESMNSMLKGQLKRRGGRMGNGFKQRDARLKFIAEVCNGLLKRGASEGHVMRRICLNMVISCELLYLTPPEEVTEEQEEGENEDEDGVPSEAESED